MSKLLNGKEGTRYLVMGNEAIARGALEAGVNVASGYPGTPSAEIIEQLAGVAKDAGIYTEWSVNEKVALEVAASASFAELRSMAVMKQNGVNVASDFLLHLAISGTRGGMVLVACEDPGALSSQNEGDSRTFARLVEIPLLEVELLIPLFILILPPVQQRGYRYGGEAAEDELRRISLARSDIGSRPLDTGIIEWDHLVHHSAELASRAEVCSYVLARSQ